MQDTLLDPNKWRPLGNRLLVLRDLEDARECHVDGKVVSIAQPETARLPGCRGTVQRVGPEAKEVKVGDTILIEPHMGQAVAEDREKNKQQIIMPEFDTLAILEDVHVD